MFIFIDELDRCRPSVAIDTLEQVKHLFDLPEIKFIIATDTTQLSHSVKTIYGEGFHGRTYLRRFFTQDLRTIQEQQSREETIETYMLNAIIRDYNALKRYKERVDLSAYLG